MHLYSELTRAVGVVSVPTRTCLVHFHACMRLRMELRDLVDPFHANERALNYANPILDCYSSR